MSDDYKWPARKRPGVQPWVWWVAIIAALAISSWMGLVGA